VLCIVRKLKETRRQTTRNFSAITLTGDGPGLLGSGASTETRDLDLEMLETFTSYLVSSLTALRQLPEPSVPRSNQTRVSRTS